MIIFSRSILTHKTSMKHHTCRMLEEITTSYIIAKETLNFYSKTWFSKHQNPPATANGQILHMVIFQKQDRSLNWVWVNRMSKRGGTSELKTTVMKKSDLFWFHYLWQSSLSKKSGYKIYQDIHTSTLRNEWIRATQQTLVWKPPSPGKLVICHSENLKVGGREVSLMSNCSFRVY